MPAEFKPGDEVVWNIFPSVPHIFVEHAEPYTADRFAYIRSADGSGIFGTSKFLVFTAALSFAGNRLKLDDEFEESVFDSDDN